MKERNRAQQDRSLTYELIYIVAILIPTPHNIREIFADIIQQPAKSILNKYVMRQNEIKHSHSKQHLILGLGVDPVGVVSSCVPEFFTSVDVVCVNVTKSNS